MALQKLGNVAGCGCRKSLGPEASALHGYFQDVLTVRARDHMRLGDLVAKPFLERGNHFLGGRSVATFNDWFVAILLLEHNCRPLRLLKKDPTQKDGCDRGR